MSISLIMEMDKLLTSLQSIIISPGSAQAIHTHCFGATEAPPWNELSKSIFPAVFIFHALSLIIQLVTFSIEVVGFEEQTSSVGIFKS